MTADVRARGGFGKQAIPGIRNIVAVGAGKGGVGKSTTAVNLALALRESGARVGLMDTDVYGPNVPQMLGITGQPEVSDDKKMIPPEGHGLKAISMGMLVPADQPIIWRGPMLHGAVQQFMRDVVWGELDYLVVDLPPGTGDVALSMAQSVPMAGAVLVTTPQDVSVSDVRKAVGMFRQLNIPILGVMENMSGFVCGHCGERTEIFGQGGGERLATDMGIPFLGDVPIDARVRSGGDEGKPILIAAPDSPVGGVVPPRGEAGGRADLDPGDARAAGHPDRLRPRGALRSRGRRSASGRAASPGRAPPPAARSRVPPPGARPARRAAPG